MKLVLSSDRDDAIRRGKLAKDAKSSYPVRLRREITENEQNRAMQRVLLAY